MTEDKRELFVVKKGTGFFVRPAQIIVRPGETFRVVNLTARAAQLFFPELRRDVVSLPGFDPSMKGAPYADIEVPASAEVGFSPIAAFSDEARDFCLGESAPGIIISK